MRIEIVGTDLPGRRFVSNGELLEHVHVGIQIGREPAGLVPGDAGEGRWAIDVRTVVDDAGVLDQRGPAVHGKRGERFLYLTWGDVPVPGEFRMFRRAKLMFGDVDPGLALRAAVEGGGLRAELSLTDERGAPRCARVRPPVVRWSALA